MAAHEDRDLGDFAHAFSVYKKGPCGESLTDLLQKLPVEPDYACEFRARFKGTVDSSSMLAFERLLIVVAAIRVHHPESPDARARIDMADYRCTRALLTTLPLCPVGTAASPKPSPARR